LFESVAATGAAQGGTRSRPGSRIGGRQSPGSAGADRSRSRSNSPEKAADAASFAAIASSVDAAPAEEIVSPLDRLSYAERLQVMIMQVQKENTKILEIDENRESTKRQRRKERRQLAKSVIVDAIAKGIKAASPKWIAEKMVEQKRCEEAQRLEVVRKVSALVVRRAFKAAQVDILQMDAAEEERKRQQKEEEEVCRRQKEEEEVCRRQKEEEEMALRLETEEALRMQAEEEENVRHSVGASLIGSVMTSAKTDVAVLDGVEDSKVIHDVSVRAVSTAVYEAAHSTRVSSAGSSRNRSPEATFNGFPSE
jgi:hypothetical protein